MAPAWPPSHGGASARMGGSGGASLACAVARPWRKALTAMGIGADDYRPGSCVPHLLGYSGQGGVRSSISSCCFQSMLAGQLKLWRCLAGSAWRLMSGHLPAASLIPHSPIPPPTPTSPSPFLHSRFGSKRRFLRLPCQHGCRPLNPYVAFLFALHCSPLKCELTRPLELPSPCHPSSNSPMFPA